MSAFAICENVPPREFEECRFILSHQRGQCWEAQYSGPKIKAFQPFPVLFDTTKADRSFRNNIPIKDGHGKEIGICLKIYGLRLNTFKMYLLRPMYPGQAPSKKQEHPNGPLYAFAEVSTTGLTSKTIRDFSKNFCMKTFDGTRYVMKLSAKKNMLKIYDLKLKISRNDQTCASAQSMQDNRRGYESLDVDLSKGTGVDPVAIFGFIVIMFELFRMSPL